MIMSAALFMLTKDTSAAKRTVTLMINPETTMNPLLVEKHYSRKHGPDAYYGQKKSHE